MVLRRVAPPSHSQANHCYGHEAGAKPLPRQTTDYRPETTCHRPQVTDLGPMGKAESQAAEAGNSAEMILQHYRELVAPKRGNGVKEARLSSR